VVTGELWQTAQLLEKKDENAWASELIEVRAPNATAKMNNNHVLLKYFISTPWIWGNKSPLG